MTLKNWLAIGFGLAAVAIAAGFAVINWQLVGDSGIDLNGWIALILGVLATLVVGVGLMALVFISNRRGYDEPPDKSG